MGKKRQGRTCPHPEEEETREVNEADTCRKYVVLEIMQEIQAELGGESR